VVILHENIRLTYAQLKEEVGPDFELSKWEVSGLPWLGRVGKWR
jgi:hypothetical protein